MNEFGNARPEVPEIIVSDKFLWQIVDESKQALLLVNDPPFLFSRGRRIARIFSEGDGSSRPVIEFMNKTALKGLLDQNASYWRSTKQGYTPARPPGDVVEQIMDSGYQLFPTLRGIVESPVLREEGSFSETPGYQPDSGYYLHWESEGKRIQDVPEEPSPEELNGAKHLLEQELLGDFPFAAESDRAHAICMLIQPFVRLLIHGSTPLFFINSPTPGSGKGLLAFVLASVFSREGTAVMTPPSDETEFRKVLTAKLIQGPNSVLIDNVSRKLDSASLSAVLTTSTWEDRELGYSRVVRLPVECTWIATGNNPIFSQEIARRVVSIRIDPGLEKPELRSDFRHPNLREWAKKNRLKLMHSVLLILRAWVAAGKPMGKARLGSYEEWASLMGGILSVVGIPGFLSDRERQYDNSVNESSDWHEFCQCWWKEFADKPSTSRDLLSLALKHQLLLDIWSDRSERSAQTRFGIALRKSLDRLFGDYKVISYGKDGHTKVPLYRLVQVDGPKLRNLAVLSGEEKKELSEHDSQILGVNSSNSPENTDLEVPQGPAPSANSSPVSVSLTFWDWQKDLEESSVTSHYQNEK